jgi:hypothetical protein
MELDPAWISQRRNKMTSKFLPTLIALSLTLLGLQAGASTLSNLKAGDVLQGTDSKSGKSCRLDVTQADRGHKTVVLTLGNETYKAVELKSPGGLITWNYTGTYLRRPITQADGSHILDNIEMGLSQSAFHSGVGFAMNRTIWEEHSYLPMKPFILCEGMELQP